MIQCHVLNRTIHRDIPYGIFIYGSSENSLRQVCITSTGACLARSAQVHVASYSSLSGTPSSISLVICQDMLRELLPVVVAMALGKASSRSQMSRSQGRMEKLRPKLQSFSAVRLLKNFRLGSFNTLAWATVWPQWPYGPSANQGLFLNRWRVTIIKFPCGNDDCTSLRCVHGELYLGSCGLLLRQKSTL